MLNSSVGGDYSFVVLKYLMKTSRALTMGRQNPEIILSKIFGQYHAPIQSRAHPEQRQSSESPCDGVDGRTLILVASWRGWY